MRHLLQPPSTVVHARPVMMCVCLLMDNLIRRRLPAHIPYVTVRGGLGVRVGAYGLVNHHKPLISVQQRLNPL